MSCDIGEVTEKLENEQSYIQCLIQGDSSTVRQMLGNLGHIPPRV